MESIDELRVKLRTCEERYENPRNEGSFSFSHGEGFIQYGNAIIATLTAHISLTCGDHLPSVG